MQRPKVSVALITYNHANYIREAVQGILDQRGDIDMEVVLGDDQSTDDTVERVKGLFSETGVKLRVLPTDRKWGMLGNWHRTIVACIGDYVALLEGDDAWADPYKLMDQITLLDTDMGLTGCFTDARLIDSQSNDLERIYVDPRAGRLEGSEFFAKDHNIIPTCTAVLRRDKIPDIFPAEYWKSPFADWIVHALLMAQGDYAFIDRQTGRYRVTDVGVWNSMDDERKLRSKEIALRLICSLAPTQLREKCRNAIRDSIHRQLYQSREKRRLSLYLRHWVRLKLA